MNNKLIHDLLSFVIVGMAHFTLDMNGSDKQLNGGFIADANIKRSIKYLRKNVSVCVCEPINELSIEMVVELKSLAWSCTPIRQCSVVLYLLSNERKFLSFPMQFFFSRVSWFVPEISFDSTNEILQFLFLQIIGLFTKNMNEKAMHHFTAHRLSIRCHF